MDAPCDKCSGTGWILKKREDAEYAEACECRQDETNFLRGKKANIPMRFLDGGLEYGWVAENGNNSQLKAKNLAEKFVKDYPAVTKGLLFQGGVGLGKTSLMCAIGSELLRQKKVDLYYIDWNDLVREMGTGEDAGSRDYFKIRTLIRKLSSVELLLFDELGASKVSQWVYDNIYYLINRRYNEQKITLFATNFSDRMPEGRESLTHRIGDRIRSRLFEMTFSVEIFGSDFRSKTLSGGL